MPFFSFQVRLTPAALCMSFHGPRSVVTDIVNAFNRLLVSLDIDSFSFQFNERHYAGELAGNEAQQFARDKLEDLVVVLLNKCENEGWPLHTLSTSQQVRTYLFRQELPSSAAPMRSPRMGSRPPQPQPQPVVRSRSRAPSAPVRVIGRPSPYASPRESPPSTPPPTPPPKRY